MRMALYARVSTYGQNLGTQKILLERQAKAQEWDYDLFVETESTRNTRPVKQKLLQALRNGDYKGVCVTKLDRWARDHPELIMEVNELTEKGIRFMSLGDNIDLASATGRLVFHMFAALGEFERDRLRERTLEGQARARAEGTHMGRPPGKKDSKPRRKSGYLLRWKGGKNGKA